MKKAFMFPLFLLTITAHAQVSGSDWAYLTGEDCKTPVVLAPIPQTCLSASQGAVWGMERDYVADVVPEDKMMPATWYYDYECLCHERYIHVQVPVFYARQRDTLPDAVRVLHP